MEKLKWGIMSTANIASEQLIPAILRDKQSEIIAIGSASEKAKEIAKNFDIPNVYTSYEALLQDPNVEIVYIPLPNGLHKEWTIKAAEHGKHVLCEKPSSLHAADTEEMIAVCEKNNVNFFEGLMYRFHPQHQRVREIIESGMLGEIKKFRSAFSFTLDRTTPPNVRFDASLGGGSLYDVGCYCIDAACHILQDETLTVSCLGVIDPISNVDTSVHAWMQLKGGVTVTFDCSFDMCYRNEYEVIGTHGRVQLPQAYRPDLHEGNGLIRIFTPDNNYVEEFVHGDAYLSMIVAIRECIQLQKPFPYTYKEMIQNMKSIEACFRSLKLNEMILL